MSAEPNADYVRPLLCRLGFHQWFGDGALFTVARRCSRCNRWADQSEGQRLEYERQQWEALAGVEFAEARRRVGEAMAAHNDGSGADQ